MFHFNVIPPVPNAKDKIESYFVSSLVLAIIRICILAYTFAIMVATIIEYHEVTTMFYGFLTILSYYCLIIYFMIVTACSVIYVWKKRTPLESSPRLNLLITGFYHFMLMDCLMVTILYWSMAIRLEDPFTGVKGWVNISGHALQSMFLLMEFLLTKQKWSWKHIPGIIAVLFFYLAYIILLNVWFNISVYPFLNFQNISVLATYISIMVAIFFIVGIIVNLLHIGRDLIGERYSVYFKRRSNNIGNITQLDCSEVKLDLA